MSLPPVELICAAMLAFGLWNLWSAWSAGRIMSRRGMVTRGSEPYSFWSSVAFSSLTVVLFGVLLLTFLDPRDFRPVLLIVACKGPVLDCVKAQFGQPGKVH